MIEAIQLTNFKTHKDSVIDFDKGVNIIQGQSDCGKSNVIRALRWVLLNSPSRGDFSHWKGGAESSVAVSFDEGNFIERIRNKSENGYNIPTGELRAIKSELPDEVKNITRMSDINVHGQDDGFYLLNDSPGKVAQELNEAVGLDIIDTTYSKINSIVNKTKGDKNRIKLSLKEATFDLKKYKGLGDMEIKVLEWEENYHKLTELEEKITNIHSLIDNIEKWERDLRDIKEFLKVEPLLVDVTLLIEGEYEKVSRKVALLNQLITSITKNKEEQAYIKEWLEIETPIKKIKTNIKLHADIVFKHDKLEKICRSIHELKEDQGAANAALELAVTAYESKLNSLDICPLCKQTMPKEK